MIHSFILQILTEFWLCPKCCDNSSVYMNEHNQGAPIHMEFYYVVEEFVSNCPSKEENINSWY